MVSRPPPVNPSFHPSPSAPTLPEMSPFFIRDVTTPKPPVPQRVPGARSSLTSKQRREMRAKLARGRPQSMHGTPQCLKKPKASKAEQIQSLTDGFSSTEATPSPVPPPRTVYSSTGSLRLKNNDKKDWGRTLKSYNKHGGGVRSDIERIDRFGSYSDAAMQTGCFMQPSHIATCDVTGNIVVVDNSKMTVQVFSSRHTYLSMFKQLGVTGACFVTGSEKLILTTTSGFVVTRTNGQLLHDLKLGCRATCVVATRRGCVVGTNKSLLVYNHHNFNKPEREISKLDRGRFFSDLLRAKTRFNRIVAMCACPNGSIAVLDSRASDVTMLYVISDKWHLRASVNVQTEAGGFLRLPVSIASDRMCNLIVCDDSTNCIVRFSNDATFSKCLVSGDARPSGANSSASALQVVTSQAVAINNARDVMFVAMAAFKTAYIDVFNLRS